MVDEAVFFKECESCPWIIIEVIGTSQKKLLCGFSSRELLSGDIILKGSKLSRACAHTGLAFTNLRPCCARLTNRQHGTSCLTTTTHNSGSGSHPIDKGKKDVQAQVLGT